MLVRGPGTDGGTVTPVDTAKVTVTNAVITHRSYGGVGEVDDADDATYAEIVGASHDSAHAGSIISGADSTHDPKKGLYSDSIVQSHATITASDTLLPND